MDLKNKIFRKSTLKRTVFFLLCDIILISLSCWLGFLLRFDGSIPDKYSLMIQGFTILSTIVILLLFFIEKLYLISWSFVSINELIKVIRAVFISFSIIGAVLFALRNSFIFEGFPRSIIFISAFLVLAFTAGLRFAKRIYLHGFKRFSKNTKPVLIVGAGDAGEQLARSMINTPGIEYSPIGFIDNSPAKKGISIHGIKVLGKHKDLPKIIQKYNIQEVIIAMPSASRKVIQETVKLLRESGIEKIKIIPGTLELLSEKVTLSHLRDISIEDLLGRDKVEIDTQLINSFIYNKTILVTGAAGSVGKELCLQILKFLPKQLIALDQRETACFWLEKEFNHNFPNQNKKVIVGNICDKKKIDWLLAKYKPEVIFHAAAYKHVLLMEKNPEEAVRNNIFGTLNLAEASLKYNVQKFVLISTDKAINPTSVMGASKQACEQLCQWLNQKNITKFCAVRFGNVLGSQGSVVPIFKEQIEKGRPITVTHPKIKRYFMMIPEACLLVMQAGAIGKGGEVFVLDMGEPIKIVDLAKEMIRLAGYEPDIDIPIVFTGIRQGEKMFEEILTKSEKPTKHEKIYISHLNTISEQKLTDNLEKFQKLLEKNQKSDIINTLKELVPNYKPD